MSSTVKVCDSSHPLHIREESVESATFSNSTTPPQKNPPSSHPSKVPKSAHEQTLSMTEEDIISAVSSCFARVNSSENIKRETVSPDEHHSLSQEDNVSCSSGESGSQDSQSKKRGRPAGIPNKKVIGRLSWNEVRWNVNCGARPDGAKYCTQCGSISSRSWRRGPCGPATLCDRCGQSYYRQEQRDSDSIPTIDCGGKWTPDATAPGTTVPVPAVRKKRVTLPDGAEEASQGSDASSYDSNSESESEESTDGYSDYSEEEEEEEEEPPLTKILRTGAQSHFDKARPTMFSSSRKRFRKKRMNYAQMTEGELLYLAVRDKNLDTILFLLRKKSPQLNFLDGEALSALHLACSVGSLPIVKALADPLSFYLNARDSHGRTPICVAAFAGFGKIVQYMIELVNLEMVKEELVSWAVRGGAEDVLSFLLESNIANINGYDKSGMTALHWAAQLNRPNCTRLLLQHPRVDVNAPETSMLMTPFLLACRHCAVEVFELLFADSRVNVHQTVTLNALTFAAQTKHHSMIKKLLEKRIPFEGYVAPVTSSYLLSHFQPSTHNFSYSLPLTVTSPQGYPFSYPHAQRPAAPFPYSSPPVGAPTPAPAVRKPTKSSSLARPSPPTPTATTAAARSPAVLTPPPPASSTPPYLLSTMYGRMGEFFPQQADSTHPHPQVIPSFVNPLYPSLPLVPQGQAFYHPQPHVSYLPQPASQSTPTEPSAK